MSEFKERAIRARADYDEAVAQRPLQDWEMEHQPIEAGLLSFLISNYRRPEDEATEFYYLRILVLPFGKYEGHRFEDIPLSYLDKTISVMPDQWIVRSARRFIDMAMKFHRMAAVPQESWEDIISRG